ncbi:GAF domain-containing protein [Solirubrobacter ginsenosidimutans]|uniref:histidine kinase n=1 Tax=Solirubrobacter ginsenosidimutans TaxID=490573 RepID=A0A9X3MM28_9ACTN|nr:GAF domain-containing protein [Solirubrobacter ginsenosidimutans]MDA0158724.1 GAF domain-containing protein [Solirubrobacter ginsenosidimutans]
MARRRVRGGNDPPLERLADEQAALRRVATLVARAADPSEVFEAVAREIGLLLEADFAGMARFDRDSVETLAFWAADGSRPSGAPRWAAEQEPTTIASPELRVRWDDWSDVPGPLAAYVRDVLGAVSTVAFPIIVDGQPWGALGVHSKQGPFAADTEARLANFSDLVATAVANANARAEVARLAEDQASLRRVATLIAREVPLDAVFAEAVREAACAIGNVDCALWRDEGDGTVSVVAVSGSHAAARLTVAARRPHADEAIVGAVLREGRTKWIASEARAGTIPERTVDVGVRSALGCPILVRDHVWGALTLWALDEELLPPETEARVTPYVDLVATAIGGAEARAQALQLTEEQAALRRVATLVAEGASTSAVFDAVAREMGRLLASDGVTLMRFEPGQEFIIVSHVGRDAERFPSGTRLNHDGDSLATIIRRTGRPARIENYAAVRGEIARLTHELGVTAAIGAPVLVGGRTWGVVAALWHAVGLVPPAESEDRMAQFVELLGTAIANADAHDQLVASRVRVQTAADEARRRVVRDLHDGAQQRLVHSIVVQKLALRALRDGQPDADALVEEALRQTEQGNAELRELAHGILPTPLLRGGLLAGLRSLVERTNLQVDLDVPAHRFALEIEASAYFVIGEALTNVAKHAQATRAGVTAVAAEGVLRIDVCDDGVGGANAGGTGLIGMDDRVAALGGQLTVDSPVGVGTRITASFPLGPDGLPHERARADAKP